MSSTSFHDFVVHDVLGHISGISSRRMFGGWGIYQNGRIFAIITNGVLYFKVHDGNRQKFVEADSKPFTYHKKEKTTQISYWELPESIMNNRTEVERWMQDSLNAQKKI